MFNDTQGAMLVPMTMSSAVVELDQCSPDWNLAGPGGEDPAEPRVYTVHVPFDVPFANVPMIHVGITGFDIDNRDTARLGVRAEAISANGFDLVVQTWLNTRVYQVQVGWIALGHQAYA